MFKSTVLEFYKNPKKIADTLGLSPAAVTQWGKIIPEKTPTDYKRSLKVN